MKAKEEKDLRGIKATTELQTLEIKGNVIPHNWFKNIKMDTGAPDLHAIMILSEIVYWYRPTDKFNDKGVKVGITKKYKGDLLQKSYADLAEKFGTTKRQVRDAMTRLEKRGILERDFRTIIVNGTLMNNVLYIALDVDILKEYTLDKELVIEEEFDMTNSDHTLLPESVIGGTNSGNTNTKSTTKSTTKNNNTSDKSEDVEEVCKKYKELKNLPEVHNFTTQRKKAIKARINSEGLETVIAVLEMLDKDEYYSNECHKGTTWYDFKYIFNTEKFTMLIERKNKKQKSSFSINNNTNSQQGANQYKPISQDDLFRDA